MNPDERLEPSTVEEARKTSLNSFQPAFPGSSVPRAFVLKTEREMEASSQRGRESSRSSVATTDAAKDANGNESHFGVQSLEDTLSTLPPTDDPSRTESVSTDRSSEPKTQTKRKREAGNRVHPAVRSAGEQIVSTERVPSYTASQLPASEDPPFRSPHLPRNSAPSPIDLTPMRLSPHPTSATPSTPRSGSPRSFQLSDVESIAGETSSQAVQSSSDDDDLERMPQLVFPSLMMPARRALTERGKYIGRARFLVMGHKSGIGSTSLINSILRSSDHVVHVDHVSLVNTDESDLMSSSNGTDIVEQQRSSNRPSQFTESLASTRMLPTWRTSRTQSRHGSTPQKRSSVCEGALDRNVTFVECPSADQEGGIQAVLDCVTASLRRMAHTEEMTDDEIVGLLSGDGGDHICAFFYLFEAELSQDPMSGLSLAHQDLLQRVSKYTNLIPLIGRADTVSPETLQLRKEQISTQLNLVHVVPYRLMEFKGSRGTREPFAISSLPGDDSDTIDASVLMSSQYLPPLVSSELGQLVENLVEPESLARMRFESSLKVLAWRRENMGYRREQRLLPQPLYSQRGHHMTDLASDGSLPDTSSKALMLQSASSIGRLDSPAVPENLTHPLTTMASSALARYNEQAQPTEPFRQIRLAKWAKDLQNSLQNQSRRYQTTYQTPLSDWALNEDDNDHVLVATKGGRYAARGHLGGEIRVIDPRDPLGIIALAQAFRSRGFLTIQFVGACGIVGAVVYYVARNWPDMAEFIGLHQSTGTVHATAVSPPATRDHGSLMRWLANSKLLGSSW